MSELGQLLRNSRMEKGISLEDLQESTKIQKRYLIAIEEGNYKLLPGSFYVRAFIKSYAEEVGLDPSQVLRMYQNELPSLNTIDTIEPLHRKRTNTRNTEKMNKWISGIVLWSFIILIAGIIYYFVAMSKDGKNEFLDNNDPRLTEMAETAQLPLDTNPVPLSENVAPSEPEPQASPEPEPTDPDIPEVAVRFVKSERGVDYYEIEHADHLVLELNVTGDACWIQVNEVTDNGRVKLEETTIKHGDSRTYEIHNPIYLHIGKASALEIKLNGQLIPTGELANPKHFQFDL